MKTRIGLFLLFLAIANQCSAVSIEVVNSTDYPLIITDQQRRIPLTQIAPSQHATINYPNQTPQPAITIATVLQKENEAEPVIVYQLPLTQTTPEKNYKLLVVESFDTSYIQLDITFQNENETILKASRYCNRPYDFSNDHRVY